MALTRKLLKTMGLTEEQVDSVIEAHTESVDGLKAQVETYKADAGKLEGVQKELDALKAANGGNDYKAMYTAEHEAFERYKTEQTAKESAALTERLYREQLTGLGIVGKRADSIVRLADLSQIKVKDGKLEDVEGVQKGIRDDYGDFIPKNNTRGANVDTPPDGNNGGNAVSRAAQIAKEFYAARYGTAEGGK